MLYVYKIDQDVDQAQLQLDKKEQVPQSEKKQQHLLYDLCCDADLY